MQGTRVQSLGREDPLQKGTATHSSILAWRIPWIDEPGRLQSIGSQRVGHDWSDLACTHCSTCYKKILKVGDWTWLVFKFHEVTETKTKLSLSCGASTNQLHPQEMLGLKKNYCSWLIDNVMLTFHVQQSDSVIHMYLHIFLFIFFSIKVYHRILNIVPCAIQ